MNSAHYIIITPARNEGEYLPQTINSVVAQTLKPRQWIIVNDGSSDQTRSLMEAAAARHSWIKTVHRPDRGFRKQGGGVIEAFYDGYAQVRDEPWDFLVKLDGDLSFEPSYFARCLERFHADPKLGLGGGTICAAINGVPQVECAGDAAFHVRGATKIYRRPCWEAIGGLMAAPGWDTIDELKANMVGWKTYTFPELKLIQHRLTGKADGIWRTAMKDGRANFTTGYHPLFMLCKCLRRLREKPYGLVAAGLWFGYFSGYFLRVPRVKDRELIRYLRRQQLRCLTLRSSLWNAV